MSNRIKIFKADDLPDICTPQICADFLGISRGRVYAYCQLTQAAGGLQSFTIGKSRKIDKTDLITWKENQKRAQMAQ